MNIFSSEKKTPMEEKESEVDCEVFDGSYELDDILLCGAGGKVYALHKKNGFKLWAIKFPTGAMGAVISIFVTDFDKVIIGANGKTACLKLMTGETLWVNKMSGFGYQEVSVISTPSRILKPKKEPISDAPPLYDESLDLGDPIIFGCSMGKIMAINPESGEEIWRYNCPGGWYNIPVAIVDPPSTNEDGYVQCVYVGAGKWTYCLEVKTGRVIWSTKVSSAVFGSGYMTLATSWNSRLAAEAYTAFSQNPVAQARDRERNEKTARS